MRALARELGSELFVHGGRGAEVTDAGWALLEPARVIVQAADRARDAVAEVHGVLRGSVRIATVAVPPEIDVLYSVRRFLDKHPDVDVELVPGDGAGSASLVGDGQVHFAISPLTHRTNSSLRFEPLLSSPLAVACPADHRLAGARDLDPGDLVDEPIIDLPRGWWARDSFDRLLQDKGRYRRVRLEVDDWWGVLAAVQRGMGIAYGPQACIDDGLYPGIRVATLADAPVWDLGVVSRTGALHGTVSGALLAAYRDQCASMRDVRV